MGQATWEEEISMTRSWECLHSASKYSYIANKLNKYDKINA